MQKDPWTDTVGPGKKIKTPYAMQYTHLIHILFNSLQVWHLQWMLFRGSIDQKSMKSTKNSSLNNNEQMCASFQGTNDLSKDLL